MMAFGFGDILYFIHETDRLSKTREGEYSSQDRMAINVSHLPVGYLRFKLAYLGVIKRRLAILTRNTFFVS